MEKKEITSEIRQQLRNQFPDEAYSQHPTKTYLTTLKAMYITERLNDIFGIGKWTLEHEVIKEQDNQVLIKGKLVFLEYNINLTEQYGSHAITGKGVDIADGYKSAITDCISKSASHLEIGIEMFKGNIAPPQNKGTTKSTNKDEPENWLNVHPSKASKALTFDFILSWERVNVYGEKIQNIRNDFKIAKDTVLKLNDEKMVSIISDENYTKTLDGNLDQINTVLKKFAMKKDQRAELKEIVLASQIDNLEQSGITYEDIR